MKNKQEKQLLQNPAELVKHLNEAEILLQLYLIDSVNYNSETLLGKNIQELREIYLNLLKTD